MGVYYFWYKNRNCLRFGSPCHVEQVNLHLALKEPPPFYYGGGLKMEEFFWLQNAKSWDWGVVGSSNLFWLTLWILHSYKKHTFRILMQKNNLAHRMRRRILDFLIFPICDVTHREAPPDSPLAPSCDAIYEFPFCPSLTCWNDTNWAIFRTSTNHVQTRLRVTLDLLKA